MQAVGDVMYPVMFETGKPGQDKVDKLKEVLGWADGFVSGGKFCAGTGQITIADISFLATFSSFKVGLEKHNNIVFSVIAFQAADGCGLDLSTYPNIASWFDKCVKLIPNYEKANGEGAAFFGGYYKSKC